MKKTLLAGLLSIAAFANAQMTTVTDASQLGSCDCYQITPNLANHKGAIWSPTPIDLTNAFDMTFDIYMGAADGADGMVFVLQQNASGIGDYGSAMGYRDVAPAEVPAISSASLAIEIDTYDTSPTVATDIPQDHIAVSSNNSIEHNLVAPVAVPNLENGAYDEFRVIWNPTLNSLSVLLNGSFIFLHTNNIVTTIFGGNPIVYFGFTAATGGAFNEHRVCMYRNAAFNADLTSVCKDLPVSFTQNSTSDLNNITSYSWDFGDGSPIDNNENPTHTYSASGSYTAELTITDISGCSDVATIEITVLPDLIIDATGTDVSCFGDSNGSGMATPQNGTAPYNYVWDDPAVQANQTATNLSPGLYTVSVTDDNGCTGTDVVVIAEPSEIIITGVVTNDDGSTNGSIDATITGGTLPYASTIWSNSASTEDISGLSAGPYTLTVTDANGCSKDTMFSIKSTVGLDDFSAAAFEIYPNPTSGYFQINGHGEYTVTIFDASGRIVIQENTQENSSFDLSSFERGIYFIQIQKEEQAFIERLVVH